MIVNMRPFVLLYLLLSTILTSCSEVTINNPIDHFSENQTEKISASKHVSLEEFDILRPAGVIRINNSSYMIRDGQQEDIFSFINLQTKQVAKGGRIGNGPQEFTSISSFQKVGDEVLAYDTSHKRFSKIKVLSDTTLALQEVRRVDTDKKMFITHCIGSNIIASGVFKDYWLMHLGKEGEICSTVDFPYFEELKDISPILKSVLHLSTLIANAPNQKKGVAATMQHGVITFFDYAENQPLKAYKQLKYYAPKYKKFQGQDNIAFAKDNKVGFCSVACDNEYVYVLYSGRTFNEYGMQNHHCENLLVYDWDGNPIKRYLLDTPLSSIQYDEKNNLIYGIAFDPEGVLVEYQL